MSDNIAGVLAVVLGLILAVAVLWLFTLFVETLTGVASPKGFSVKHALTACLHSGRDLLSKKSCAWETEDGWGYLNKWYCSVHGVWSPQQSFMQPPKKCPVAEGEAAPAQKEENDG